LTNAHCIYPLDKAGRPTYRTRSITVYPGRQGGDEPFGGHDSNGWAVSRHWSSGRETNCQFDYGMIRLRNDVGNKSFKRLANQPLRWWGAPGTNTFLTVADPATLAGSACMTAGYPYRRGVNELAARVMRRSDGNITGSANVAYCRDQEWRGRVTPVIDHQSRIVNHDADTERGQSGGPLWIAGRDNALLVAGIHQGFATWTGPAPQNAQVRTNIAVRFGRDVLGQVNQWMDPRTWRAALSGVAKP
jgi:V8-like Glu-specific endopeptidase